MSISFSLDELNTNIKHKIAKDLELKIIQKTKQIKYIYPYRINEQTNYIYLPFSYAIQNINLKRPLRTVYEPWNNELIEFTQQIRPEQSELIYESLGQLNKSGSIIISAYTGFGKTASSIYIASKIKLKTLIVVNKIILLQQWKDSCNKFTPQSQVQIITNKTTQLDTNSSFFIINAQNIEKIHNKLYQVNNINPFSIIGNLILDEAHLILAETLSRCMQYITPRYFIGLTATPYRPDGLNILFDLYFGTTKIIRKLHREHQVYKVKTMLKPNVEYMDNGKINWNSILDSQASDVNRNELIINIIKKFDNRNFLVLVKRIAQGQYLLNRLLEEKQQVTSLLGPQQEFDIESRILIGTSNKIGVGFDHPKLDALLLASDIEEYFIQYLGRVFRTRTVIPIIFDLVDQNSILEKHFYTRKKIYQEHGGTISNYIL